MIESLQAGHEHITKGLTPLHWATELAPLGVVKVLIEYGADLSAKDFTVATPAIRAINSSHFRTTAILGHPLGQFL